jgi:predicted RNase H-like nuclease (RuvC/YqgF family)
VDEKKYEIYKKEVKKLTRAVYRKYRENEQLQEKIYDLEKKNKQFINFVSACRYTGEDGLPQLKKDAQEILNSDGGL